MSFVSGTIDSSVQLLVPALQAAATIKILNTQKSMHDSIANKRIGLIDNAVKNYIDSIDALATTGMLRDSFGSVPEAAEYEPVDMNEETFTTISDNLQNVPAAERQIAAVNILNVNSDIVRMVAFSPEYLHLVHKSSSTVRDLLHGKLPIDEVINVLTDEAEQAFMNGRVGNTHRRTHRSLGLSRLSMQRLGRASLDQMVNIAQKTSPVQRQQSIQELLTTPSQRIGMALTQAQLIQNSLQNLNNSLAAGDPAKLGELQIQMQKLTARLGQEAQRGNMINQFVPNYASLLTPQINSISEGLLGSADRTGADTGGGSGGVGQGNGKSNYSVEPNNLF